MFTSPPGHRTAAKLSYTLLTIPTPSASNPICTTKSPTCIYYLQIHREIGNDWTIASTRHAHINKGVIEAGVIGVLVYAFHDADHPAPENLGPIVAVARKFNEVTDFH
tara:strand:- start:250 stop:573 length:324 start_codon:yes stop_codon:yes gene_type:complete